MRKLIRLTRCRCGCKKIIDESKSFVQGHHARVNNPMNYKEFRLRVSRGLKGHFTSEETKRKISKNHYDFSGDKNPNWKGGITLWTKKVIDRDKKCMNPNCKGKSKRLVAHHIKDKNKYPELRYDVDNGITYCNSCHVAFHNRKRAFKRNVDIRRKIKHLAGL